MTARTCPECQFDNPGGFKFCGQCGSPLVPPANPGNGGRSAVGRTAPPATSRTASGTTLMTHADRRQVTVLFCDLVSSDMLARYLDAEDFRQLIHDYRQAAEPVISARGGFVSRFLGDGILAIFGYPVAHEDDAIRAADAALDIIEAIQSIQCPTSVQLPLTLAVRIGIATGLVVAGDLIGQDAAAEQSVTGETPTLAARLQALAQPDSILISARTQRLLGQQFDVESLGEHRLKGFEAPVPIWQVRARRRLPSRFASRPSQASTALVNRTQELAILNRCWNEAQAGNTRIVLISGEAGIGKSRVTQALSDSLVFKEHFRLRFQCSPYNSHTALHPVCESLLRTARIDTADSPAVKREKLRAVLAVANRDTERSLPAMTAMLGIPGEPEDRFDTLSPQARQQATLDALFRHMIGLSHARPVYAIVEDIHWSDPTTLTLLKRFGQAQKHARLLVVLTARGDAPPLHERFPDATHIQLLRLAPEHSGDLVRNVAAGTTLPRALIQRIVTRADGVALFAEELTRALIEDSPQARDNDRPGHHSWSGRGSDQGRDPGNAIPETLHDLLMARLDRSGAGKRVAQIASVIGRHFSHEHLLAIAEADHTPVYEGLEQLVNSGLVLLDSSTPATLYQFKHALVRDTAYASLLREERRHFHRLLASRLDAEGSGASPELRARHHAEAGNSAQAIACWLLAGQQSAQRSAFREASQQLHSGLKLLRQQSAGDKRDRQILTYLVNLGPAIIATQGAGSEEADRLYREAVALTEVLPESADHFTALWGWWRLSKDFASSAHRAQRLQALADQLDDDGFRLQAHHCQWATCFHLADHWGTSVHAETGISLYADRDYRSHAARYGGHDPRVCALGNLAQSQWLTGYPKRAVATMQQARLWAEELEQAGSLIHAMDMNLLLLRYREEPDQAGQQASELIAYAQKHGFSEYLAKAQVFQGWAKARTHDLSGGIAMMSEGIQAHDAIGGNEDPPVLYEMLADGYLHNEQYQEGLDTIDRALAHSASSGLQFWQAELYRRRGELLQLLDADARDAALSALEQALEIADRQGARMLALRALTALCRTSSEPSRAVFAQRLAELLTVFEEGRDTRDWLHATELLGTSPATHCP